MLWILRTGAPWRDLPKHYGPHSTVANRFYRWWGRHPGAGVRRRGRKQFRRVATLYEKRGRHYLAFVTLAAIILWLPV